ncbi:hypothetical protein [Micromonospora sp. NPDC048843]|uniref:hypothetical protein n=1 Tax=Micromonospora sp. NPDC048843 TaxID=3155389 RepID=UPI0033EFDAEB
MSKTPVMGMMIKRQRLNAAQLVQARPVHRMPTQRIRRRHITIGTRDLTRPKPTVQQPHHGDIAGTHHSINHPAKLPDRHKHSLARTVPRR